jgi:hypothetical protein
MVGAKRKRHAEELKAKMALETIRGVRRLSEDLDAPDTPDIDRAVEAPVGGSGAGVVPTVQGRPGQVERGRVHGKAPLCQGDRAIEDGRGLAQKQSFESSSWIGVIKNKN